MFSATIYLTSTESCIYFHADGVTRVWESVDVDSLRQVKRAETSTDSKTSVTQSAMEIYKSFVFSYIVDFIENCVFKLVW